MEPLAKGEKGYSWLQQERYQKEDEKALKCKNCDSTFFVEFKINRYQEEEPGIVGQQLSILNDLGFPVYMCINCKHVHVPANDGAIVGRKWELWSRLADMLDPLRPTEQ